MRWSQFVGLFFAIVAAEFVGFMIGYLTGVAR